MTLGQLAAAFFFLGTLLAGVVVFDLLAVADRMGESMAGVLLPFLGHLL